MRAEDTCQWLKILDKDPKIKEIYDEIFVYRRHAGSTTMSDIFREHNEKLKAVLHELKKQLKNPYVIKSINNRLGIK
jgi:DNA-directed RNA polymerase specialized sigma subunit